MDRSRRRVRAPAALLAAAFLLAGGLRADEAVVVLSSDAAPYWEAYEGFQDAWGKPVTMHELTHTRGLHIPPDTKIVIAFGGEAALQPYPSRAALIYALAPGSRVKAGSRGAPLVSVPMQPSAAALVKALREIQPGLSRLAVFYHTEDLRESLAEIQQALKKAGGEARMVRVESYTDLPEGLRSVAGWADAFWLPPDPQLVNRENFAVLRNFSVANKVPFYVPTMGLVDSGATASVSLSFRELGRQAGQAARELSLGRPARLDESPDVDIAVNTVAAKAAGLSVPAEVLKKARRVVP